LYSARDIGFQALAGVAVDEELRRAGKTCCRQRASGLHVSKSIGFRRGIPHAVRCFVINCFGIEMVLCDLYLKTKGLLFDTFLITVWYKLYRCDVRFLLKDKEKQNI